MSPTVMAKNLNPAFDLPDIQKDIPYIQKPGRQARQLALVPGRLRPRVDRYERDGLARVLCQPPPGAAVLRLSRQHAAAAPELARPDRLLHRHGEQHTLPKGGVFYIRGGYTNQMGLTPRDHEPNYAGG